MTRLTSCVLRDGGRIESSEIDDPGADDVAAAIESLVGEGEVYLGDPLTKWLGVAGGPSRYFVAYCASDAGPIMQARAEQPPPESIEAVIGGQRTTLSSEYLVTREVAVAAALQLSRREGTAAEQCVGNDVTQAAQTQICRSRAPGIRNAVALVNGVLTGH